MILVKKLSLTETHPELAAQAVGWYICLVSVAVSVALIFVKRSKTDDVDAATL